MTLLQSGITKSLAEPYTISKSLRFNAGSSSYMDSGGGVGTGDSRTTWTFSFWVKKADLSDDPCIWSGYRSGSSLDTFVMGSGGSHFYVYLSSYKGQLKPNGVQRDPTSWYHYVTTWDTTNSTAADRMRIYINGERVSLATDDQPSEDEVSNIGLALTVMNIGQQGDTTQFGSFYLADMIFTDGTSYSASDFGETNAATNQWVPKDPSGLSFGTNGFWFKFENSSDLGEDYSGNGNDYAANGLYASDQNPDTPTTNICYLNPLSIGVEKGANVALSQGNLVSLTTYAGWEEVLGTQYVSSGKWYAECLTYSNYLMIGVAASNHSPPATSIATDGAYGWALYPASSTSELTHNGSSSSTFSTGFSSGDVWGLALDLEASPPELTWYRNDSLVISTDDYTGFELTAGLAYTFYQRMVNAGKAFWNLGQDSAFSGQKTSGSANASDDNGIGDFYYDPPSGGYLTLCAANLDAPSIKKSGDFFNSILYTGDDASPRSLTGVGFQPDFTWGKDRSAGNDHWLTDAVRGTSEQGLASNQTYAEGTGDQQYGYVSGFGSDGFTLTTGTGGNISLVNNDTTTYVAWNWLAGTAPTADNSAGAGATPTAGSGKIDGSNLGSALAGGIAAKRLSANTTAGFSIVSYEGTDANATIGHGLSQAPELLIIKALDTGSTSWAVGADAMTSWAYSMELDTTDAQASVATRFNSTAPTASVFSVGDSGYTNAPSGENFVAYAFHSVEGYSKVGSYTGNGNADGTFISTGFRPAFVMIKNYGATGDRWLILDDKRDTYNVATNSLAPNLGNAESTGYDLDFVSNGIKIRDDESPLNTSGIGYLYLAFAESPFKYANAR